VDLDIVTKLTRSSIDLDTVMKELFKGRAIENSIAGRSREVYDEFVLDIGSLARFGGSSGLGFAGLEFQKWVSLLRHLLRIACTPFVSLPEKVADGWR
jgi:hypothetical protein